MDKDIRYRSELKYLLDMRDYLVLKSKFSAMFRMDENTSEKGYYHIRSLYFDDMKNTAFFEKLAGVQHRKKYRIRTYEYSDELIRFEKKVKDNNASYKRSAIITKEDALNAMKGDFSSFKDAENPLLREIYLYDSSSVLRPSVITDYDREAFVFEPCNVRVTFDKNIRTALTGYDIFNKDLATIPVLGPGQVVLEVKYDGALPNIISSALNNTNAIRMAVSKFTLCKKYTVHNDWEVERWG